MPAIGATDPANLEAQACAEMFFSRQLEQPRRISPYPGVGGSGGYAVWYHKQQLQRFNAGEAIDVSLWSIYRCADRLELFRQTGNRERTTIVFLGGYLARRSMKGSRITIQPQFSHLFLSFLRGDHTYLHLLSDMSTIDPQLYGNLMFLKSYEGDVSVL